MAKISPMTISLNTMLSCSSQPWEKVSPLPEARLTASTQRETTTSITDVFQERWELRRCTFSRLLLVQ
jgi:hypothetical protein